MVGRSLYDFWLRQWYGVDPENGDFRFKPNSPALKMGIKEIDISKIGLQNKEK